jgi:YfiH family protein
MQLESPVIYSSLLSQLDWLEHGFGTRAAPLSQQGPQLREIATLTQIHSARVLIANAPGLIGEGDALVTDRAGLTVSVRTADCYPVLLVDLDTRVVAAVHAGWRGTAAGVVSEALQKMNALNQTNALPPTNADRIWAAIGPGIGACCYEVGEEVARRFGQPQAGKLDLAAANYRQLREAGVPDQNIDVMRRCTFCEADRFHSFRRDKDRAGRMISYITVSV